MGEEGIIIPTELDATGFNAGSKKLQDAIKSFGRSSSKQFGEVSRSVKGFVSSTAKMVPAMVGITSAIGVLRKAVSTYISQNEELGKKMNSIWTALGNVVGPVVDQIISWITSAISYFLEFLRLLGVTNKNASQLSKSAKSAGKELRSVMGFDELNKLSDSGGGGGGGGNLEDKEAPQWIKDIAAFIKNGEWAKAGSVLGGKLNEMVNSVDWDGIGQKIGYYTGGALKFIRTTIDEFDLVGASKKLGSGLSKLLKGIDFSDVGAMLEMKFTKPLEALIGFIEGVNWATVGQSVVDFFKGIYDEITNFFSNIDWGELVDSIWNGLISLATGIDYTSLASSIAQSAGASVGAFARVVLAIWENIKKAWKDFAFDDDGTFSLDKLFDKLLESVRNIKEWVKTNIIDKFIEAIGLGFNGEESSRTFSEIFTSFVDWVFRTLGELFGVALQIGQLAEKIGDAIWDALVEGWNNIKEDIVADFTENGELTMESFLNGCMNIFDSIYDWIKEHVFDPFVGGLKSLFGIRSPSTVMVGIGDNVGQGFFNGVDNPFKSAHEWLSKHVFEPIAGGIEKLFGAEDGDSEETKTIGRRIANGLKKGAETVWGSVSDFFTVGSENIHRTISDEMSGLSSDLERTISPITSESSTWGSDLVSNLRSGIESGWGWLTNTLSNTAGLIRSYLHFSEPDVGPLSDFSTYMPDMIKLMVQGIETNKDKALAAVSDMAEEISDEIQGGDYSIGKVRGNMEISMDGFADKIVSGFENLIQRLQEIADRVTFAMPVMATGVTVPYSVSGSVTDDRRNDDEIIDRIISRMENVIYGAVSRVMDGQEHTTVITLDGDEIAASTTKKQSRNNRARGV